MGRGLEAVAVGAVLPVVVDVTRGALLALRSGRAGLLLRAWRSGLVT